MKIIQDKDIWMNPEAAAVEAREKIDRYSFIYVQAAQNRFMRFLPYIAAAFPETAARKGVIESPLLKAAEAENENIPESAKAHCSTTAVFIKDDTALPISGSLAARGGFNAVMHIVESLSQKEGLLGPTDNYVLMRGDDFRKMLGRYCLVSDAEGKLKDAVNIMAGSFELESGFEEEKTAIYLDAEESEDIFFGCAAASVRLKIQLYKYGVTVDSDHKLIVYIPYNVAASDSAAAADDNAAFGLAFGLKELFGSDVVCFFTVNDDIAEAAECFRRSETFAAVIGKRLISGIVKTGSSNTAVQEISLIDAGENATHIIWKN